MASRVDRAMLAVTLLCICATTLVCAHPTVGGLHDEQPANAEVRKLVNSMREDIEKMAEIELESLEPISFRKQTVAGTNYFVKVLATEKDGTKSHMHVRIYKHFVNKPELSAVLTRQEETKPLEYFQ